MDRYLVSQFELENPFPKIDISCYLEIFDKKNEYYITIVENGDCDRNILFLSFGVIEFEEDKIIFKDIRTGCDLVMTKVGKELFVNKGYYFMKNKCYSLDGKTKIYLSLGKWAKQGNKLLLQDLSLDCNFVYLIKNNYLYSIYSPNEINDTDRYSLDRLFPFIMR